MPVVIFISCFVPNAEDPSRSIETSICVSFVFREISAFRAAIVMIESLN